MRLSLKWLKEYIETELPVNDLARVLTLAGLEVESIESIQPAFEQVVVAKVLSTEKHPQADKLCVAKVTDGQKTYQIVCGAPNCRAGLKTALALEGAKLKDEQGKPFVIKNTKIRGVESFGMLCAADELNLSSDSAGILELSEDPVEGTDFARLLSDTILEIGLTPNLAHCASVIGVARELSAQTRKQICYPKIAVTETNQAIDKLVKIEVKDSKACPRYASRLILNVKIAPSPFWLQQRLLNCGIRPINNVVDIVNYVVLEMGHPLHAFDFDRLEGHQIIVRKANKGEAFTTLDSKQYSLQAGDILICDAKKPVALAGIMGGENSEVTDKTKNVLLEAAVFDAAAIRKTSKQLGIITDASKRFERGVDPNGVTLALERVAMLLEQWAGGQVVKGVVDVKSTPISRKKIKLRLSRVNELLGTHLSLSEVEDIFNRLGFSVAVQGLNEMIVTAPTYRLDVSQEIDLIEEVARIYGYDNIVNQAISFSASKLEHVPIFNFEREIRSRLISEGLQEMVTCDLIGPSLLNIVKEDISRSSLIKVLNPTSIEQSILRTTLLPGLLQVVKWNFDHQQYNVSGFEIGRAHIKEGDLYKEPSVVGIVMTGTESVPYWGQKSTEVDFYALKGVVENLFDFLKMPKYILKESSYQTLHSGRQASIYVGDMEVGSLGEVHPSILRRLDVTPRIYYAELNLHDLMQVRQTKQLMEEIPIYPGSGRDWTVTLPESLPLQALLDGIQAVGSTLLEKVEILDIYRSDKVGANLKNVTLHFMYRDHSRTILQEEVEAEHKKIIESVSSNISSWRL